MRRRMTMPSMLNGRKRMMGVAVAAMALTVGAGAAVAWAAPAPAAVAPAPSAEAEGPKAVLEVKTRVIDEEASKVPPGKKFVPKEGEFKTADELLTALEKSGNDIRTLQGDIRYTKRFAAIEGGEEQERTGTLYFKSESSASTQASGAGASAAAGTARMFQVEFERLTIDDKRRDERRTFIFDGEWLTERQYESKQQFRRRVVRPGERIDPLAIGEGPFPIPVGQKKDKILARFDAELLDPTDGWPGEGKGGEAPNWLNGVYQLRLIPKTGTDESRQFGSVRLWYIKGTLMPRMAVTDDKNGASTEVFLTNVKQNEALPAGTFSASKPEGWEEQVTEYQER